jgi:DNA-binding CsgD family transcriptional regulator
MNNLSRPANLRVADAYHYPLPQSAHTNFEPALQPESALSWDMIRDLPPHKVFLWDRSGRYLDCSFPNPIYGHFVGLDQLQDTTLSSVFPKSIAHAILEKIHHTLVTQIPEFLRIELLNTGGRTFQAIIRLFPLSTHVLGLVNDFPLLTVSEAPPPSHPSLSSKKPSLPRLKHPLTYREQQIVLAVGQGQSNEVMAAILGISVRTIKFHLLNLYQKLGVSSRASLKTVAPFLITTKRNPPTVSLSSRK